MPSSVVGREVGCEDGEEGMGDETDQRGGGVGGGGRWREV